MAERPQNPRPMVRCAAGLDPDHRRCKRLEEGHHLFAPQLLTQNHLLGGVHPMKLEKMFRCIHANSANLFHGRSPLFEICNDLILAQSMPSGGRVGQRDCTVGLSQVGSRTGAPVWVEVWVPCCLALSSASVPASRPCHVSSPLHVERSLRIARTTLPHLLHAKAYGTYPAGATFSMSRRTR